MLPTHRSATVHSHSLSSNNTQQCFVTSIKACKTRTVLTEEQVIQIFRVKLANTHAGTRVKDKVSAASLAKVYMVGEKTIRDIWTGRTWFRELIHLDPARAMMLERLRMPGRPRGSQDKKAKHEGPIGMWAEQLPSLAAPSSSQNASDARATILDYVGHEACPTTNIAMNASPASFQLILASVSTRDKVQTHSAQLQTSNLSAAAHSAPGTPASRLPAPSTQAPMPPSPVRHGPAEEAVDPLPESSRADDPFHDDWPYWPARDPPALACESALASSGCRLERWP